MVMADALKRRQSANRMPQNGREAAKPVVSRPQLGSFRGGFKAPVVRQFDSPPQQKPGAVQQLGQPSSFGGPPNKFGGGKKVPPMQKSVKAGLKWMGLSPNRPNAPSAPVAAPGPQAPDIETYLGGDQVYQLGLSDLIRQLSDYDAQANNSRNSLQSAFSTAMQRMAAERTNALNLLKDDFAGRGLLNSGLFAKANSDYDTEYQNRVGDLNTDQLNQMTGINTDAQNFKSLVDTERTKLRQDAILRRASQYGILP